MLRKGTGGETSMAAKDGERVGGPEDVYQETAAVPDRSTPTCMLCG